MYTYCKPYPSCSTIWTDIFMYCGIPGEINSRHDCDRLTFQAMTRCPTPPSITLSNVAWWFVWACGITSVQHSKISKITAWRLKNARLKSESHSITVEQLEITGIFVSDLNPRSIFPEFCFCRERSKHQTYRSLWSYRVIYVVTLHKLTQSYWIPGCVKKITNIRLRYVRCRNLHPVLQTSQLSFWSNLLGYAL